MRCAMLYTVAVFVLVISERPLQAYCLQNRGDWSWDIPVWIVTSGPRRIDRLGFSTTTASNYIRSAIQEWNEASGFMRTAYFAGEVASRDHGNDGVTIYVTMCGSGACGAAWYGCTLGGTPDVAIELYPPNCAQNNFVWAVSPAPNTVDLQGVVAHELGHAFGLGHSSDVCATSQNGTTIGVMRSPIDSSARERGVWRWPRRDDIEGLRDIFGTTSRLIWYRENTTATATTAGWSGENYLPELTRSPVTATDPANNNDNYMHGVTWIGENDKVKYITGDWTSWRTPAVTVDTSPAGSVWSTPKIAQGNGRILVAWLSGEPQTGYNMTIRWGIRQTGGAYPFVFVNGPSLVQHKILGVAYDPANNVFLLTYMDWQTNTHVITINASTGVQIANVTTSHLVHEYGGPSCTASWWWPMCHIPMVTTGEWGPSIGWYSGWVSGGSWFDSLETNDSYFSYSSHELTNDASNLNGGFVGTINQGVWGSWVYHKGNSMTSPIDNITFFNTDYYPIGVGAMTANGNQVKYRAYYAR